MSQKVKEEITKENYKVMVKDLRAYHVKLEMVEFDSKTGERKSKAFVQKYPPRTWNTVKTDLVKQGYTIEVLFNPIEYAEAIAKKQAEDKEKADALNFEAQKKLDEENALKSEERAALDRKKLIEELRAELLEEFKNNGVNPEPEKVVEPPKETTESTKEPEKSTKTK
ncbi:MAG: hypothetical protein LBP67_05025 [Bacteroidales bacterium]|jgi:hypothetical protein|nr:hypothetical protein [Bacteroidales bacterium]